MTHALTIEQAIGQKLLLTFDGPTPSSEILKTIHRQHLGGVTIFPGLGNTDSAAQVRELTAALQTAARESGQPPLLIGVDQEGGQLTPIRRGATLFPGNLALGATGSVELARQVGRAIGRELAAVGANLNYAPACDVNSNPRNPVIGTRSFGEEPALVAAMAGAMVDGLQAAGVAATAKHFPGHGDTAGDTHHGAVIIPHGPERLARVELPPFEAAIAAGVKVVMAGHMALPQLHGGQIIPATLSAPLLRGLLRDKLGFTGVTVTDCMDMGAIEQGDGLVIDSIAAAAAGLDLLLNKADDATQRRLYTGLGQAARNGLLSQAEMLASAGRVLALKAWLARQVQPPFEVVGCAEHRALAAEVAAQAVTLVRDTARLLPLTLPPEAKIGVITPVPVDLTPADTSSLVACTLAAAVQHRHSRVTEIVVSHQPTATEIAAVREQAARFDLVVVGTLNACAQSEQPALVEALLAGDAPVVVVAMRMPYDLQAFPAAPTYLCSYSLLEPSLEAVARIMFGEVTPSGRLPVSIPGLYPVGHRAEVGG
jgi:beta-N-acetylhexosaminidase